MIVSIVIPMFSDYWREPPLVAAANWTETRRLAD